MSSIVFHIDYDANDGVTEAGFREVLLPQFMEGNFHTGDIVTFGDSEVRFRGRIRCFVAVMEDVEQISIYDSDDT